MARISTIQGQLLFYLVLFVALLLGLSSFSIERLGAIELTAETLNGRALGRIQLIAEIDDELLDFIRAEASRTVALSQIATDLADEAAAKAAQIIADTSPAFAALGPNEDLIGKYHAFRIAWKGVVSHHNSWVDADPTGGKDRFSEYVPKLISLHKTAGLALNSLRAALNSASDQEARDAEQQVETAFYILAAATGLGLLLVGWLVVVIRNRIAQPLASITASLTSLASGHRDVGVPETGRSDEFGKLAQAFEVFRQNAMALENAHAAAEAAQLQARLLARHDPLTGLPNRRVFAEELGKAVVQAKSGAKFAVFLVDLDRFKPVNDIHGHPTGDAVLCEIANRLRAITRTGDTVARLGGDEFGIVVECGDDADLDTDTPIRVATETLAAIKGPIRTVHATVEVGASIGIARCPRDGADAETLLRAADIAMYRAKREGRGMFRFFEPNMDAELRARSMLEAEVRNAVARGEIKPYYQPIVRLPDCSLVGFEILARWHHPDKGFLYPDVFISLVEELGLSSDLTAGLLRRACLDARDWPALTLALNVSPTQLSDALLPVQLLTILTETGFPPARLEIEVTEAALLADLVTAKTILSALQTLGIRVALDDFGTGYSSLSHLRELRFDKIKIDRSFVDSMGRSIESTEIVSAILGLAKSLSLPTIAEGIENSETLRRVIASGFDYGQGYLFGRAMPAYEADSVVQKNLASQSLRQLRFG